MTKRFARLEMEDLNDEQRPMGERSLKVSSDGLGGPYNLLLRSPVAGMTFADLLSFFNNKGMSISPKIRRMVILMLARMRSADYAWWAHSRRAHEEGITDEQIATINRGEKPADLDPLESAVFDYVIEVVSPEGVSEETFQRLREHYDEKRVVELTLLCGTYNTVGMILQLGQVDAPKQDAPPLMELPAPPFSSLG